MINKRILFFTTTNIFDKSGNGGVKASREHYEMVKKYYGEENTFLITYVSKDEFIQACQNKNDHIFVFEKLSGNLKLLLASVFGCRIYLPKEEKKILSLIKQLEPETFFCDFSVNGRIIRKLTSIRTIVFFHNVEADYTFNKVKNDGLLYLPAYYAAKKNDFWATKADIVICFNERDSSRLNLLYGRKADYIFPISLKDRFNIELCSPKNDKRLLFLGSCFGPNEDGIDWFIKKVMPLLQDITLDIVGVGFENKRDRYSNYKNVNVIGTVINTDWYYYTHPVVVMPIRYGAGMKVKTAEALMFGKYIIASDEALEGYDVDGVNGIFRCNTIDEYMSAITCFFNQSNTYINYSARELFVKKYSTEVVEKEFLSTIASNNDMRAH